MNKFLDVILSDVKITNITNNFRTNISLKLASNKYHTYKKKNWMLALNQVRYYKHGDNYRDDTTFLIYSSAVK